MTYKIAAILFVCFFTVTKYSAEARYTKDQIKEVGKLCNATETDLEVAANYDVPSTPTGKCLMKCVLTKVQTLTEDGLYKKDQALASMLKHWSEIEPKKLEDLATECEKTMEGLKSLAKTEPCEYGYQVAVCINKLKILQPECCTQKRVYVRVNPGFKPYGKIYMKPKNSSGPTN